MEDDGTTKPLAKNWEVPQEVLELERDIEVPLFSYYVLRCPQIQNYQVIIDAVSKTRW